MNNTGLAKIFYEISCESFSTGSPWSKEQFLSFLTEENHHYLVTKTSEKITGFVLLSSIFDEAELLLIAIDKNYQSQGVGTELLTQGINFLREKQVVKLFIEVRESNLVAQKLYEKMGCKNIGSRKNYYQQPKEDALIWQLTL